MGKKNIKQLRVDAIVRGSRRELYTSSLSNLTPQDQATLFIYGIAVAADAKSDSYGVEHGLFTSPTTNEVVGHWIIEELK